ncbi:MAG: 3-deoxy-8-phosphooctulonate synthase, partial [Synechococcaceae bacterium WB6_3A_227]|nr:3-deoxy-8-phosphooctulonate synthase [Synechococcaceae bacterium WB6_3A_227]
PNMVPLQLLEPLLKQLIAIRAVSKAEAFAASSL